MIFHFLPYNDLNNALLVCRLDENIQLWLCLLRSQEVGEQPTLWTNLSLGFYVYKEGRGKEGLEVDEEGRVDGARVRIVDGEEVCDSVDICGWTEQLMELLTMPRLQCLEHLELNFFFMGEIFWEDCMLFLQLVSDFAPSVKRLSWIG